jgi:hypothetical protein
MEGGLTSKRRRTGLRVYTDLEKAKVTLDGNEVGALEGGQFSLDDLSDGQHSLEIIDGTSQAKIVVVGAHDTMPLIQGPLEVKNLKAIVVTNGPQRGQILSSYGPLPALMDGKQIGALSSTPLELPNLLPGTHDLDVGTGKDERKVSFQVGAAPALTVFLSADRTVGNLLVVAGEDGATVLLNGRKYPRTTKHGQLVIANLEPKRYTVLVVKDGFQKAPPQEVNIQKGQGAKLIFALQPVPTLASLVIAGATPLVEVLLDGKPLGTIQQDGSFSVANVQPGPHTIELKKDLFKPKELQRQFVAGGSVRLTANEVALESATPPSPALAPAKLVVQTVAGAQVIIDGRASLAKRVPMGVWKSLRRLPVTIPWRSWQSLATISRKRLHSPPIEFLPSRPICWLPCPSSTNMWWKLQRNSHRGAGQGSIPDE